MLTSSYLRKGVCVNKDFVHSGAIGLTQGKHARYVISQFFSCYLLYLSIYFIFFSIFLRFILLLYIIIFCNCCKKIYNYYSNKTWLQVKNNNNNKSLSGSFGDLRSVQVCKTPNSRCRPSSCCSCHVFRQYFAVKRVKCSVDCLT